MTLRRLTLRDGRLHLGMAAASTATIDIVDGGTADFWTTVSKQLQSSASPRARGAPRLTGFVAQLVAWTALRASMGGSGDGAVGATFTRADVPGHWHASLRKLLDPSSYAAGHLLFGRARDTYRALFPALEIDTDAVAEVERWVLNAGKLVRRKTLHVSEFNRALVIFGSQFEVDATPFASRVCDLLGAPELACLLRSDVGGKLTLECLLDYDFLRRRTALALDAESVVFFIGLGDANLATAAVIGHLDEDARRPFHEPFSAHLSLEAPGRSRSNNGSRDGVVALIEGLFGTDARGVICAGVDGTGTIRATRALVDGLRRNGTITANPLPPVAVDSRAALLADNAMPYDDLGPPPERSPVGPCRELSPQTVASRIAGGDLVVIVGSGLPLLPVAEVLDTVQLAAQATRAVSLFDVDLDARTNSVRVRSSEERAPSTRVFLLLGGPDRNRISRSLFAKMGWKLSLGPAQACVAAAQRTDVANHYILVVAGRGGGALAAMLRLVARWAGVPSMEMVHRAQGMAMRPGVNVFDVEARPDDDIPVVGKKVKLLSAIPRRVSMHGR